MGDIVDFQKKKQSLRKSAGKVSTLCGNGHHSWVVQTDNQFDVKRGELVTVERCRRCGKTRTRGS